MLCRTHTFICAHLFDDGLTMLEGLIRAKAGRKEKVKVTRRRREEEEREKEQ